MSPEEHQPTPSVLRDVAALWAADPTLPFDLTGCTCTPWVHVRDHEIEIAHDADCLRLRSLRRAR